MGRIIETCHLTFSDTDFIHWPHEILQLNDGVQPTRYVHLCQDVNSHGALQIASKMNNVFKTYPVIIDP